MQHRTLIGLVLVATCLLAGASAHGCRWKQQQQHQEDDPFDHPFFHEQAADDLAIKVDELTDQLASVQAETHKLQNQNAHQAQRIKQLDGLVASYKQDGGCRHTTTARRGGCGSSNATGTSWSPLTPLFFFLLTLGLVKTGCFVAFCLCPGFNTCVIGGARRAAGGVWRNCCNVAGSPFATGLCWGIRKCLKAAVYCTLFVVGLSLATSLFFWCPGTLLFLPMLLGCCGRTARACPPQTVIVTRVRDAPPSPEAAPCQNVPRDDLIHSPDVARLVQSLVDMGYSSEDAREALRATRQVTPLCTVFSLEQAVDHMARVKSEEEKAAGADHEPQATPVVQQPAGTGADFEAVPSSVLFEAVAKDNQLATQMLPPASTIVPAPAETPKEEPLPTGSASLLLPAEDSSSSEDWDSIVVELKEMGFEGPAAVEAAKEAGGDVKVAVKLMVKQEREAAGVKSLTKDW